MTNINTIKSSKPTWKIYNISKRKNTQGITEIIQKEKQISISREAVRNSVNREILHAMTKKNTVWHDTRKFAVFAKLDDYFCQSSRAVTIIHHLYFHNNILFVYYFSPSEEIFGVQDILFFKLKNDSNVAWDM